MPRWRRPRRQPTGGWGWRTRTRGRAGCRWCCTRTRSTDGGPHGRTAAGTPGGVSGLLDDLARRLALEEVKVPGNPEAFAKGWDLVFAEGFHERWEALLGAPDDPAGGSIVSKWRQKDRLKTTAVALVLCLNIGVDPPDTMKVSPCAHLECWMDPASLQPRKALEAIGKSLQAQYERWQPRAKYKLSLDPTFDDVKKLCTSCRRNARSERVLFHYNGHGVPKPTINGEIWVFNKSYTQYIPQSIYDLQSWVGTPSICVFDCSAAGLVVNAFQTFAVQRLSEIERISPVSNYPPGSSVPKDAELVARAMQDTILLASCSAHETLPHNHDLPADVFTACLTTPIKMALTVFCKGSLLRDEGITASLIDRIPGKHNDRKTLLGELNWIFTAITDTIAWNTLPRPLFQKLFRQDLLVASLFRNFLLAERIMHKAHCTPISYPRLPPTYQHHMWQAWDLAAEMCLAQLPALLSGDPSVEFRPSPFFTEQLTAFEVWLEHGSEHKQPPEQLPVVLQVLLSQSYRLRALVLLGRFLDLGSWAVELALSVGIFPYVLKLLQATALELRQILVFIWTKILALDQSCQADLAKDNCHMYFIKFLEMTEPVVPPDAKAGAAFVLASICDNQPKGQAICSNTNLLQICVGQLEHATAVAAGGGSRLYLRWLCLCLAKLWENAPENVCLSLRERVPSQLVPLLAHAHPEVRAAAVYALGCLIQVGHLGFAAEKGRPGGAGRAGYAGSGYSSSAASSVSSMGPGLSAVGPGGGLAHQMSLQSQSSVLSVSEQAAEESRLADTLAASAYDGSPMVRYEAAAALARFSASYASQLEDVVNPAELGTASQRPSFDAPGGRGADASGGASPRDGSSSGGASPRRKASGEGAGATPSVVEPTRAIAISQPKEVVEKQEEKSALFIKVLGSLAALASDPAPAVARAGQRALDAAGLHLHLPERAKEGSRWGGLGAAGSRRPSDAGLSHVSEGSSHLLGSSLQSNASGASSGSLGTTPHSPSAFAPGSGARASKPAEDWLANWVRIRTNPSPTASAESSRPGTPVAHTPTSLLNTPRGFLTPPRGGSYLSGLGKSPGRPAEAKEQLTLTSRGAGGRKAVLPRPAVFARACKEFQAPLLVDPGEQAVGSTDTVFKPAGGARTQAQRLKTYSQAIWKCRKQPLRRLDKVVVSLESDTKETALAFDPLLPYLYSADQKGKVRVYDLKTNSIANLFAAGARAAAAERISFLQTVNETQESLLLTGSADGAVRVWKGCDRQGGQRQISSFGAVHMPSVVRQASQTSVLYAWQPQSGTLFTAGARVSNSLCSWNLQQELCVEQLDMGADAAASCLAACQEDPLVVLGTRQGGLRFYDLRTPDKVVCESQAHGASVVGIVCGLGDHHGRFVTGSADGELKFHDLRKGELGIHKRLEVHDSHHKLQLMQDHPNAALFATASSNVVSVWDCEGTKLGSNRFTSTFLSSSKVPVRALAFHPLYQKLAAAGSGSIVAWE